MKWLNEIRSKVEEAMNVSIDYVWYVGECWHKKVYNPADGGVLLFGFWATIVFLPFITPLLYRSMSWLLAVPIGLGLILFPYIFCRLRYTKKRRESLKWRYGKIRNLGRRLVRILIIYLILTLIAFIISYSLGLIWFDKIDRN